MLDRISGILQADSKVTLTSDRGPIEVIIFPLQAAVGWEMMVQRSVEAFRHLNGQRAVLEGSLHGNILASAQVVSSVQLKDGSYRGRLQSASGTPLTLDLRIETGISVMSADFFRDGNYYGSMRGHMRELDGALVITDPRFIFDWEVESRIGGRMEIRPQSADVLGITCTVPDAMPTEYTGNAVFDSEYYRVINIEVDKLSGLPWPPEYSTSDIPHDQQPADIGSLSISLASLFKNAGFNTRVNYNDAALGWDIGEQAGRPGERDRWDEREMHEMMDTNYSRNLSEREWWLYLLITSRFDGGPSYDARTRRFEFDENGNILNDGVGTTGIIFDHATGNISDPWTLFREFFERENAPARHLYDFGRGGAFANSRARQGVAVFWREMIDFVAQTDDWYKNRQLLRTIMHELGHALNMAHTWLVGRADTTSFMNYPHNYPHGSDSSTRVRNYWSRFSYRFDPEEIFHMRHGFYNEVIPGGKNEFMQWTSSSVFIDPTAGGTRSNVLLNLKPTKTSFKFTEPVTVEVNVANHSSQEISIGRISPAYGDIHFVIRKPNGAVERYHPPLFKCEATRSTLAGGERLKHVTSLAVGANGFTFDTPGRYEITATLSDPSSGVIVVARPVHIWVGYPDAADEGIAKEVFTSEAGLFLYMAGGDHLRRGKNAFEEVAHKYPDHPFSAHANLVLGLNLLSGQKSPVRESVTQSKPEQAKPYFEKALGSGVLSQSTAERLKATIGLSMPSEEDRDRRARVAWSQRSGDAVRPETPPADPDDGGLLEDLPDRDSIISEVAFTPRKAGGGQYRIIITDEMDEYDKPVPMDELVATTAERLAHAGGDNFRGTARRAAKISIADAEVEEYDDLIDLLETLPSIEEMVAHDPQITTGRDSGRVEEENRNVRVRAFLYAASRENDNDFHLIIGRVPGATPKKYMTIEISGLPPVGSPSFHDLNDARNAYKNFFADRLPGTAYHRYVPPIPVMVEGSLFFDLSHSTGQRPGPQALRPHMPTIWEIHPVTFIDFEP